MQISNRVNGVYDDKECKVSVGTEGGEACQVQSGNIMKGFVFFAKAIWLYLVVSSSQWGATKRFTQICILKGSLFRLYCGGWQQGEEAGEIGCFYVLIV